MANSSCKIQAGRPPANGVSPECAARIAFSRQNKLS